MNVHQAQAPPGVANAAALAVNSADTDRTADTGHAAPG